jgi:uncharacterized integral membrane protein (TIGR00697 family)
MVTSILSNKPTRLFLILGGFFVANALVAEFIGAKIFSLEDTIGIEPLNWNIFGSQRSLQLSAGVLLWPVVFIMTDVINEYFGQKGVKFLSWLTVGLIIYAFIMVYGAIALTPADWWVGQNAEGGVPNMQTAFSKIYGQGLLIIIGSVLAFLFGQLIDVFIFHRIKKLTGEDKVWLRATGSTLVSQFIDSFVVLYIAFKGGPEFCEMMGWDGLLTSPAWTWGLFLSVGTMNYIYKAFIAAALTPVIYGAHSVIDNYLGKERAEEMKMKAAI